jgi:hypothetical protein
MDAVSGQNDERGKNWEAAVEREREAQGSLDGGEWMWKEMTAVRQL